MDYASAALPIDLFAAGRALAYLAALGLVGCCVFVALIPRWRGDDDDERSLAARTLARAWAVAGWLTVALLLAHAVRGYGQVKSFLDPGEPFTWDATKLMLLQSDWGHGWLAQLAVAIVAAVVVRLAARRPAWGLAGFGTVALLVVGTSPLTGHAGEHPWGATFGVGLHAVHLLGGGIWLGTLAAIVAAALPLLHPRVEPRPADHAALARLIGTFSPLALVGAGLAVGAGSLLAWSYVGSIASLTGSSYGRALLVKVALLAATMALGAWNWRRVSPRLGTAAGSAALTRSARTELGIGILLVLVTAVLVSLPAPGI